jgi:hypothetical protein
MTPESRKKNLVKAGDAMLNNRAETAKKLLREHIRATMGFERLSLETGLPAKRLKRMFAPKGELRAREMLESFVALQRDVGIELHLAAE